MILRNRGKFAIAILAAFGLLYFFQTETVNAVSDSHEGRNHLVDGGQILEEIAYEASSLEQEIFSNQITSSYGITPASISALADIRVMPMGDSITKGYGTCVDQDTTAFNCIGYREDLWNSLVAGGYRVNFVGSLGASYQPQYSHDNDHEGHGGKTADWFINRVNGPTESFLANNPADIVLLHVGTNDFSLPLQDPNDVVVEVSQILDKIDNYESSEGREIWVILAKIIKRYDSPDQTQAVEDFNDALQTMADLRISGGDSLTVVDMETALTYQEDFFDELHPNESGYSKMALIWYDALVELINFPPTITNPGIQSSIQNQTISLQMQATDPENDSLTYSATGLPTGLSIDPDTGEISGKISNNIPTGAVFQVTVTADDKTGFPDTDPYNKDQVTFNWKIGEQVLLPLVIR